MCASSFSISGDQVKCVPAIVDNFMFAISFVNPGTHLEKDTRRPTRDCASFLVVGEGSSVKVLILLISGKT